MKNVLKFLSILSVIGFVFLVWKKRNPDPIVLRQYPFPENQAKLVKKVEEINKKIPKKLFEKPKRAVVQKKEKSVSISKPKHINEVLPEDEIATHYQKPNGDLIITSVNIVDKMIIAHGDLIVGEIDDMDEFLERARTGEPIILPKPVLWPGEAIPYEIDSDLPNLEEVQKAIDELNKVSNIKWEKRESEKDFVRFKSGPLNCYSPLGKIGGEQTISLAENCKSGSIMHEMLHTMGLLHEQNRTDRDKYIRILWENIDSKNHLQFQKISNKLLDPSEHPFDFKSIMLYAQNAFSKYPGDLTIIKQDGDTYTANKEKLSSEDLKKINYLYPKK